MPLPPGPLVGTCGFAYPEWRGRFYPPELSQAGWLGFYARVFEALELDGTFYRPPTRETVEGWAAALPDRFALAAKVPRVVSHEARLRGEQAVALLRAFADALDPLGDRLLAVVLQLPPSLTAEEGKEPLARLLGTRPVGLPVVVEVRHRSWDRPWLAGLLSDAGAGLALADRPGEPPWPRRPAGARYLRLLGDRAATPVIGVPVRDRAADLDRWAAHLERARGFPPAAAFVNNRFEGAAFTTALALRRRLGQPAADPTGHWPAPPLPGFDR